MLILSRKIGESIIIGDDVTVTVLCLRDADGKSWPPGAEIQIGIDAPFAVRVDRKERRDKRQS